MRKLLLNTLPFAFQITKGIRDSQCYKQEAANSELIKMKTFVENIYY